MGDALLNREAKTYECDSCGKIQHVNPREFRPYGEPIKILINYYGWEVYRKSDTHYCRDCK